MAERKFSLDGDWQLFYFPEGSQVIDHPDQLTRLDLDSVKAVVPGNVELDLMTAGKLPDPFYASNIHLLRPYETFEWWYLKSFVLPEAFFKPGDEGVCLVFEGLDTLATVWLNGVEVGRSANMLVAQRFDISPYLRAHEENVLCVRLSSAVNAARRQQYEPGMISWEHRYEGLHLRKAPHMWGWDILPRAVSAGIWRSVILEVQPRSHIEWVYYCTRSVDQNGASLGVRFQVRTDEADFEGMEMVFSGACGDHQFEYVWPLEFCADTCTIWVPQAKLWYPRGLGDANLYHIRVQLRKGDRVLADRTDLIGIRTIRIERTEVAGESWTFQPAGSTPERIDLPPDPGSHFVIYINDQPVMVKGTNWVPLNAFHSRDLVRLEPALVMVEDLGCNMIRCWGGNVYESEAFFNWCDAHGVMVWQDFALACCIYPQTEDFLASIKVEAEEVVKRLRNHASLALWCGDNEVDMVYLSEGRDPGRNRLTREVLPQVVERLDPQRHFVPSSPYVPERLVGEADAVQSTPEQHLWGPRGYFKGAFYTRHSAHFIGEIGYHGCPNLFSIQRFISAENLWPPEGNDEWQVHAVYHWKHHAVDRDRIQLMQNQVREFFGRVPERLEDFIVASQIVQAEAKKFFIESTRLRKWSTSGILWWNLIDGWPQFSDAVVDYYFGKKLAYHYIRRVQQPVCLIIGDQGTGKYLPVVACNDNLKDYDISYRVVEADSGDCVSQGEFHLPANQNWQVGRIRCFASQQSLYLIEWEIGGQTFGSHYLAGTPAFDFERYRAWLPGIAGLSRKFDVSQVGI